MVSEFCVAVGYLLSFRVEVTLAKGKAAGSGLDPCHLHLRSSDTRDALAQLGRSTLALIEPLGRLIMAARVGGFGSHPIPDPSLLVQP
jgi:hypothetical protein